MISIPDTVSRESVVAALWTLGIDPENTHEINIVPDVMYVDYWSEELELLSKKVKIVDANS